MANVRKIINDPVYGFITIDHPLILDIISHPIYQRLRNIHQMAFAHLVYPGAVHSRLHHSLGAYHLMGTALAELKSKNVDITEEEEIGAKLAILLHDLGHGPFSHALEKVLIPDMHHEKISLLLMQQLNKEFNGKLDTAIAIFTNQYSKKFLHQLISGQLDVDRMDYLNRDSFFTGVSEGVIGYDRIIKMLTVKDGQLLVEEKAIYSIEKFLVSRRLMYWQVYLHKTVVSAEMTLVNIFKRVLELKSKGIDAVASSQELEFFLNNRSLSGDLSAHLSQFCLLDDHDVMSSIKNWCKHPDFVLSTLSKCIVERKLLKIKLHKEAIPASVLTEKQQEIAGRFGIELNDASYFVFAGEATNTTYNPGDERINILFKDGQIRDISQVDYALINYDSSLTFGEVKKHYICFPS